MQVIGEGNQVKLPAAAKRASWNLVDQMISSLTNAVLSFMVARAVDPITFGGFAVAFTVFALVIGAARALCTSPLNIRFSDAEPAEQKRAGAAATGLSLVIAVVIGIASTFSGILLGGSTGEALLVMGLVLPAVIVQDSYRYVFFSRQRPVMAAANDGVWAVLQIGAAAVLLFTGVSDVGPFVLVWGVAGAVAAAMAFRQAATLPSPGDALRWWREQNNLTRYTFASWATQQGTMQGALLAIAAIGTVAANGALRGGQILLGPAAIISTSALTFAIPEFSRRRQQMSDRQWVLAALAVSAVTAFLALCWGAIFLLMPDAVGAFLLNETWPATSELLGAAVVAQVLSCLTVGPVVMLYAIDRAKATFRVHLALGTCVFLGGIGGVLLAGGPGAQWGFAIANGAVLPFWFIRLLKELRVRSALPAEPTRPDDDSAAAVEATAAIAGRRPQPDAYGFPDLDTAFMATMVLPHIAPQPTPPAAAVSPHRPGPTAPVARGAECGPPPVRPTGPSHPVSGGAGPVGPPTAGPAFRPSVYRQPPGRRSDARRPGGEYEARGGPVGPVQRPMAPDRGIHTSIPSPVPPHADRPARQPPRPTPPPSPVPPHADQPARQPPRPTPPPSPVPPHADQPARRPPRPTAPPAPQTGPVQPTMSPPVGSASPLRPSPYPRRPTPPHPEGGPGPGDATTSLQLPVAESGERGNTNGTVDTSAWFEPARPGSTSASDPSASAGPDDPPAKGTMDPDPGRDVDRRSPTTDRTTP